MRTAHESHSTGSAGCPKRVARPRRRFGIPKRLQRWRAVHSLRAALGSRAVRCTRALRRRGSPHRRACLKMSRAQDLCSCEALGEEHERRARAPTRTVSSQRGRNSFTLFLQKNLVKILRKSKETQKA